MLLTMFGLRTDGFGDEIANRGSCGQIPLIAS
jgi:hypothetical protein